MSFGIRFNVGLPSLGAIDIKKVLAAVSQAMMAQSGPIKELWMTRAVMLDIRGSGDYLRGIGLGSESNVQVQTTLTGEMSIATELAIENTCTHAAIVEDGHVAFALPEKINWSGPNVKRGKNGVPFLHIPFGHSANATPKGVARGGLTRATQARMMPRDVYARAKRLDVTNRENAGAQRTASGGLKAIDRYSKHGANTRLKDPRSGPGSTKDEFGRTFTHWAGERTYVAPDGSATSNPAWQGSKFAGMMRSSQGAGGSKFTTIRTITPYSRGWRIPAQAGKGVIRSVQTELTSGAQGQKMVGLLVSAAVTSIQMQLGGDR